MPAALLVIYDGNADDPDAFIRYYIERHVPIVWTFPNIRGVEIDRVIDGDLLMIARFYFDSPEDARTALASPQRQVARADMANFPPYSAKVRHQIIEIAAIPPR
jgi:uncharacterized protein (TIGR02118 family)